MANVRQVDEVGVMDVRHDACLDHADARFPGIRPFYVRPFIDGSEDKGTAVPVTIVVEARYKERVIAGEDIGGVDVVPTRNDYNVGAAFFMVYFLVVNWDGDAQ